MHYKAEIERFPLSVGYDVIGILEPAKAPKFQKSPTFDQFCTSLYSLSPSDLCCRLKGLLRVYK
jgi:hypothetical protein